MISQSVRAMDGVLDESMLLFMTEVSVRQEQSGRPLLSVHLLGTENGL